MNWTKENLIVRILLSLANKSPLTGEWPNKKCKFCNGRSSGYSDSQEFDHDSDCTYKLIKRLEAHEREQDG